MATYNNQEYSTAFFDYAGVLTDGYTESAYPHELSGKFGIETDALRAYFAETGVMAALSLGELDEETVIAGVCERFSGAHRIDPSMIRTQYYDPDPTIISAIDKLRERTGIKLGVISNIFPECAAYVHASDLSQHFDELVLSCEIRDKKPNASIFRYASNVLGVESSECIFFDDVLANVTSAEGVGMTAIHVTGPEQLRATLESIT